MNAAYPEELLFVALGGAGEIGMNLNLYGFGPPGAETWMMVDLGITFGDGSIPGVDVIMPDPSFIEERQERLAGLVLTHAHEDHLGAVPYLWPRLRCPVYATPFTASILRRKLREVGLEDVVPLTEVTLGSSLAIGPFDLELISLTHSIPEPNALAINTPLGLILHTGDWKLDPGPVVGPVAEEDALIDLGEEVTAYISALKGGELDLYDPDVAGYQAIKDDPDMVVLPITTAATRVLRMRVDKEPWTDVRVRLALKLCQNRDKILKLAYFGEGLPGQDTHVAPVIPAYCQVETPKYDPERAKALLAEAGYPNGIDVSLTFGSDSMDVSNAETLKVDAEPAGIAVTSVA